LPLLKGVHEADGKPRRRRKEVERGKREGRERADRETRN
jgi:hypothetical protein